MRILLAFLLLFSVSVKAETSVWIDPDFGISHVYPDGWMDQVLPHDELRHYIIAPHADNLSQCKVSAKKDKRYEIFPARYFAQIVPAELNQDFWSRYLANYKDARVNLFKADGSLGLGYASYIDYSYQNTLGDQSRPMRGIAYATIYHDMFVVMDCATDARVYDGMYPVFATMIKSLTFDPEFHPLYIGAYRNFFKDMPILLSDDGVKVQKY